MKSICLIPARGGSKRIPRKNIRLFNGRPLIEWSINIAKSSQLFDDIYISTDDPEIAEIARNRGAIIPFMRPDHLSDDMTGDKDVRDHFTTWMREYGIEADVLCYLYATAAFITERTLIDCQELLIKSKAKSAIAITTFDYPVLRSLKRDKDNFVSFMWEEYANSRSQDLPELVHDAGQCYFFKLKEDGIINKTVGLQIPRFMCQDIDTEEDLEVAENLFKVIFPERVELDQTESGKR